MKNLYTLLLFICLSNIAYGVTVYGIVSRTNGDSVDMAKVYIYPDTLAGPKVFQTMIDTTDKAGNFSFLMPAGIPNGTVFKVSTLNCDSVSYITNTHIYTGGNIQSNMKICVKPPTDFSGYVYLGGPGKRPKQKDAMVYLISKCPGNVLSYIDSVTTDTNGYYKVDSFPSLATGCELVMKAALKSSSADYRKYFPAYHESNTNYSLRWSGARDIPVTVARAGINIFLPEAINPTGGPSTIAGYAKDSSGNRLPDKVLFVTDMPDVTVDYTYTNQNGDFSFTNLPFGTYKIFGDVWGKDNPDLVVKVDADHVNIFNIVFLENSFEFRGYIATSVAGRSDLVRTVTIYPNPARDHIYIQGADAIPGKKQVTVMSLAGAVLYTASYETGSAVTVPVSSLPQGVYILKLSTEQETAVFRITK